MPELGELMSTVEPIVAAEASGSAAVPITILIVALLGFGLAYFVVGPGKRKGPKHYGDIPLAMRPYHSDEELETTGMERAMAWGVALAVFASLFLPLYWLIEPDRINRAVDDFYEQDVAAGRAEYQNACASCHGVNLEGGSAPHPLPEIETPWPVPALNNIVARYEDSEIVDDVRNFIELTLVHGRPGTPMQSFSVANDGPYSDNQLDQIIAYILSVQTGEIPEAQAFVGGSEDASAGQVVYDNNCARCHGPDALGYVGPQLLNVFERYGWTGEDDESLEEAREVVRQTLYIGRYIPMAAPMPSFDQTLTDEAIEAVIDHLESFQETGGPSSAQIGVLPVPGDSPDEADVADETDETAEDDTEDAS